MISHALIIGETRGMEQAVHSVLLHSEQVIYRRVMPPLHEITPSPELILICQQWPDEYTQQQAIAWFDAFPVARWVVGFSEWCNSDGRTRDVWPAAIRVPTNDVSKRIELENKVIRGECPPLPMTAGYDEIFAFENG